MTARLAIPVRTVMLQAALALLALASLALAAGQVPFGSRSAESPAPVGGKATLAFSSRVQLSGALGGSSPAYHVSSLAAGVLSARNRTQQLSARFTAAGVAIGSRAGAVTLALREAGSGSRLQRVPAAAPSGAGNRVRYARAGMEEWYENGPLGIEQGFTLTRPPLAADPRPSTVTLALAASGGLRASSAAGGRVVFGSGAGAIAYGHLAATDARGRPLASHLRLSGTRILLTVDSAGASFPLRIDPLVQNGEQTSAGEESEGGMLGLSVALSADGSTALAGAPHDGTGAVWVYVRTGGVWRQQGSKLIAGEEGASSCGEPATETESEECVFGRSVALSGDGNVALIGAPGASAACRNEASGCQHRGVVRVYVRNGTAWSLQETLTGGPEETGEGRFGRSVAISADGATAIVGAPHANGGRGAAWAFTDSGGTWSRSSELTGAGETGEGYFGVSVALAGDGSTVLVGAPADSEGTGAAWIFRRPAGESEWSQQGEKLTGAGEAETSRFGYSGALSRDGNTALIGARSDHEAGAAFVFRYAEPGWSQQAKLTDTEAQTSLPDFGYSVALSSDGHTALVGGPTDARGTGAAWLFTNSSGAWAQDGAKLTGASAGASPRKGRFGFSVALQGDGETALAGAPVEGAKLGALWAFADQDILPAVTSVSPSSGPVAGATAVEFEASGGGKPVAAQAASFTVDPSGSITAVAPESPSHRPGVAYVRVLTPEGHSPAVEAAQYTYLAQAAGGGGGSSEGAGGGSIAAAAGGATVGSGVLSFSTGCAPSLLSRTVRVLSHSRASVRLQWHGTGVCSGTLTLRLRVKHGHRSALRAIGATRFALRSTRVATVTIRLNALGRSKLRLAHGRLGASLLVLKLFPGSPQARSASVKLVLVRAKHR